MLRLPAPSAAIRIHRFSRGGRSRLRRLLPLLLPLVGGFAVAFVVDALLPAGPTSGQTATTLAPAASTATTSPEPTAPAAAPTTTTTTTTTPMLTTTTTPMLTTTTTTAVRRSTRDADLERRIDALLENGKTPYSAVVVIEAGTGRLVALAEHSTRGDSTGLATRPMAPAASVFKLVTSSALLERGVPTSERVCFHGGKTRMQAAQLKDDARKDHTCVAFDDVVPLSANVAVAKLAHRYLTPASLRTQAEKWGFGKTTSSLAGEVPSVARIPDDSFDFATTAAGFGDVQISALQGATIASIVANEGLLVPTSGFVDDEVTPRRVISPATARALKAMMTATVTQGTGKAFRLRPTLPVSAAGKTGSLTDYKTGLDTSWFVGFAPAESPRLIVAAVVVNTSKWHIKAPWLAKESLRLALKDHGPPKAGARVAAR